VLLFLAFMWWVASNPDEPSPERQSQAAG